MTNVADVLAWKPDELNTASTAVNTAQTKLDEELTTGVNKINGISWGGKGADQAKGRMESERTKGSAVSDALMKLSKALSSQVDNLNSAKSKVQAAVDGPRNATGPGDCPGFEVDEEKVQVSAAKRIAWWGTQHLNKADMDNKTLEENHTAAQDGLTLATALSDAVGVAQAAIDAVNQAKGEVDTAYNGLGDPATVGSTGQWPASTGNTNGNTTGTTNGTPGVVHGPVGTSHNTSGGPPSEPPTGTKKEWIDQAIAILKSMGYDTSDPNLVNDLSEIISKESGDNPGAINESDINWINGHPSKGLMQTIDGTFNSYAAPGHSDIWNPVDNIVAGARYAFARYGSVHDVPGLVSMRAGGPYVGY